MRPTRLSLGPEPLDLGVLDRESRPEKDLGVRLQVLRRQIRRGGDPGGCFTSKTLGDQGEAFFACRGTQLFVPAGEVEFLAGRKGDGAGEVDRVISAKRVGPGAFGRLIEKSVVDGVAVDAPPDVLQILKRLL